MIEIDGKVYRNLQEQVDKNKEDIEDIIDGTIPVPCETGTIVTVGGVAQDTVAFTSDPQTQLNGKVDVLTDNNRIYVHAGGLDFGMAYTEQPTPNTICRRSNAGLLKVANGVADDDCVTMQQLATKSTVSGTDDGTNWQTITIDGTTKAIPSGGSGGDVIGAKFANGNALTVTDKYIILPNPGTGSNNNPGVIRQMGGTYACGINFVYGNQMYIMSAGYGQIDIRTAGDHGSDSNGGLNNRSIIAPCNLDYAVKAAMTDGLGATWTDAEKLGVWKRISSVKSSLDSVLVQNGIYDLGSTEQSSLTLTLPSTNLESGAEIYVAFKSGATATALTIVGDYEGSQSYNPSANKIVELSFKYVCGSWVLVTKETAVS